MKWLAVAAIALLLIVACVVYFRYEHLPVAAPAVSLYKSARPAKPFVSKPRMTSPVDISGPLKDRALVQWALPEYPEWALVQGVAGLVRMKIRAGPDGYVKSLIEPVQLSGDQRLDVEAEDALRQWQFEEKPNTTGIQWGVVTIHFSLLPRAESQPGASVRGVALRRSTSGAWECVRQWVGDVERRLVYICRLKKA